MKLISPSLISCLFAWSAITCSPTSYANDTPTTGSTQKDEKKKESLLGFETTDRDRTGDLTAAEVRSYLTTNLQDLQLPVLLGISW